MHKNNRVAIAVLVVVAIVIFGFIWRISSIDPTEVPVFNEPTEPKQEVASTDATPTIEGKGGPVLTESPVIEVETSLPPKSILNTTTITKPKGKDFFAVSVKKDNKLEEIYSHIAINPFKPNDKPTIKRTEDKNLLYTEVLMDNAKEIYLMDYTNKSAFRITLVQDMTNGPKINIAHNQYEHAYFVDLGKGCEQKDVINIKTTRLYQQDNKKTITFPEHTFTCVPSVVPLLSPEPTFTFEGLSTDRKTIYFSLNGVTRDGSITWQEHFAYSIKKQAVTHTNDIPTNTISIINN